MDLANEIILDMIEEEGIEATVTFYQRLFLVSYPEAKDAVYRIYEDSHEKDRMEY